MTRRQILKGLLLTAGLAGRIRAMQWRRPLAASAQVSSSDRQLLGTVGFADEPGFPMEAVVGKGLDGRLCTDLSVLTSGSRVTPTEKFYIRTCASSLLPEATSWHIGLRGLVERAMAISIGDLKKVAQPCGVHLMECSGNGPRGGFGLMSVAEWEGVPLVSRNHGAPVRLVVPGWYGCACIKWVNAIALVEDNARATSQMREFASRTHQAGVPRLAGEYEPAVIDPAAMPIRVEKWRSDGRISYRVIGILWGARHPLGGLEIQFNPQESFVPVTSLAQTTEDSWGFWTHTWTPAKPGHYAIRLKVKDPGVRTRRLDAGFYRRSVEITEV